MFDEIMYTSSSREGGEEAAAAEAGGAIEDEDPRCWKRAWRSPASSLLASVVFRRFVDLSSESQIGSIFGGKPSKDFYSQGGDVGNDV